MMFEYDDWKIDWYVVCFWGAILLAIVSFFILLTNKEIAWNDGYCPNCNVKYELVNIYRGFRYYICPECGKVLSKIKF